jgi:uncharacterized protein (DUF302 family)
MTPEAETSGNNWNVVTKLSPRPVVETVSRLTKLVESRGMKFFAVIDQQAEAKRVGLDLRDTVLVLFGSPAKGTPVMEAAPLAALDLPLKVVVWADGVQTKVSYLDPGSIANRYDLGPDLAANLSGINALTDAVVAST